MKTGEAEMWLRQQLIPIYDEREASNIASLILEKITGLSRMNRSLKKEEPLLVAQLHHLTEIVQRMQQHEPVQYVLEEAYFRNLTLFVNNLVLIPRPETEELAGWVIDDVKDSGKDVFYRKEGEADETTILKIVDVGTGSGCIALALKKEMPKAEVWGCDNNDEALTIARRNGSHLNIRVDFIGLNFLEAAQRKQLPAVHIIVSNPPYIPQKEEHTLHPNVQAHEPHSALFVPDDNPLLFYEALAHFGKERLYENGSLYVEIHEEFGEAVLQLFQKNGYRTELKKDMQGKDRMIKAHLTLTLSTFGEG